MLKSYFYVSHYWSGERSEYTQLLHAALHRGRQHSVAIVGMEDQRIRPGIGDPLPKTSAANEISDDLGFFPLRHIAGHHFEAQYFRRRLDRRAR